MDTAGSSVKSNPNGSSEFAKVAVLIVTAFIDMVGFAMIFPLLPFYGLRFEAPPWLIGVVIAAYSIAQLTSAPLWGWVSDRHGRRPALLAGLAASGIAYVVFGLANSIWMLLASRIIQGAGGGTTGVINAYVTDAIVPARRAQALGWITAATSLGVALGPLIGSFGARAGGAVPGLLAAALCGLNLIFTWRWLPESKARSQETDRTGDRGPGRQGRPWTVVTSVMLHPTTAVARLILIYGAGMLGFSALSAVFGLYLEATFGITEATIGYFFAYLGGLSFFMRAVALGPVVRRLGEVRAMMFGVGSLIAGLVAYAIVPEVWMMPFAMPLIPIGTALLFPTTTALLSRAADPAIVGVTMGAAQTFGGIARVIAPLIATYAFQNFGHKSPFFIAAAVVAGVGVLTLRLPARVSSPEHSS